MKLESQVVSLELSKRLKELGAGQESLFYYSCAIDEEGILIYGDNGWKEEYLYSAFTVAELGELIPARIQVGGKLYRFRSYKVNNGNFLCGFYETAPTVEMVLILEIERMLFGFSGEKEEANARALVLIYLLENRLITL